MRDFGSSPETLQRALVTAMDGTQVPLAHVADIKLATGPGMIRDENGRLSGYVYVDIAGRDVGGYVEDTRKRVEESVKLPSGYSLVWSGQYESIARAREKLKVIVPITLLVVFLLIYMNTGYTAKTLIVPLAVPFSAIGAMWLLYLLDYNTSIAVWVGLIALLGVDAETGVFMLLYLDLAFFDMRKKGLMRDREDLKRAIVEGAVKRLRSKFMTVAVTFTGLVPIMWSTGAGSDLMKRIAAPMVGGVFTSFIMELLVCPAIYLLWRWHFHVKGPGTPNPGEP